MIGLIASAKLSEAAAQSIRSWSPVLAGVDGLLPFDPFAARLADLGRVEAGQDLVPLSIELSGRSRGHLRLEPHRPLVVLGCLDFLRRQVFSTPARDFLRIAIISRRSGIDDIAGLGGCAMAESGTLLLAM